MGMEEIGSMRAMIETLLNISEVKVLDIEINHRGEVIIGVESTKQNAKCYKCGQEINEFQRYGDPIELRHFPILGHQTYIRIRPKRYRCSYCSDKPTSTQQVEWYKPKSPNTKAYEQYLLLQMINSTIEDVSIKHDIGYKAIEAIIDRHISSEVDWERFKEFKQLGIDEIALKKGHRDYVAIVTARDPKAGSRVLAVLPDKKKETVKKFLESIPQRLKETIKEVCTDMYEGFVNAVKEALPNAKLVVDRYHVAKMYRDCVDSLRKKELKRLKQDLSEQEYDQIKGAMWPSRKNLADLDESEFELLNRLFEHSPELKQAHMFREELSGIFDQDLSKAKAKNKINDWQTRVRASGLTCFDNFLKTLDNYMDEITNYFSKRHNSGFVEGINNKIKVLKRRCYGIFNTAHLFQRIFLDLEGYNLFAHISC